MKRGLLITFAICFSAIAYSQSTDSTKHSQTYVNHSKAHVCVYVSPIFNFNNKYDAIPNLYNLLTYSPNYLYISYISTSERPSSGYAIGIEYDLTVVNKVFITGGIDYEAFSFAGTTTGVGHAYPPNNQDSSILGVNKFSWAIQSINLSLLLHYPFLRKRVISINIFGGVGIDFLKSESNSGIEPESRSEDGISIKGGLSFELGNSHDEKSAIIKLEPIISYQPQASKGSPLTSSFGIKLGIIFGRK